MDNETTQEISKESTHVEVENKVGNKYMLPVSIIISGIMITYAIFNANGNWSPQTLAAKKIASQESNEQLSALEEAVLPSNGVVLPVSWGGLGSALVSAGVIDADKLTALYNGRGAFTNEYEDLLLGQNNNKLIINSENAGYLLNLFWALGLANKNPILETGEMTNPQYGGAGNFASTGGWTIAQGKAMDHYSKHQFFDLTAEQQDLVDKVSRGIYRPCCGNAVHFPDCNHGMAMLGLLELMASQGATEQDMWKAALAVNSYWFPDTYLTIAMYMSGKGIAWSDVNPEQVLSIDYSSAQGYAKIAAQVSEPKKRNGGSGCGVGTGETIVPQQRKQVGCGI